MKRYSIFVTAAVLAIAGLFCSGPMTEQEIIEKAETVHLETFTVDTHADTPMRLLRGGFDLGKRHDSSSRRSGKVDLPRMKEGGLDALFFAVFIGQGPRTPEKYREARLRAEAVIDSMEIVTERYSDLVELAYSPEDGYRLEDLGKRAAFLGMENGYPVGKDLSLLTHFYKRGIRYITLCHTRNNDICDSSTDSAEWNGLSPFGEKCVKEMNRIGLIVDVSHISDSSFYDVLKISDAPVIASHSSCRALCDSPRNLSDEMLEALKENKGVIQICILNSYLKEDTLRDVRDAAYDSLRQKFGPYEEVKDPELQRQYREAYYAVRDRYPGPRADVKDLVDHIDHVKNKIGIDHVGIGSDFDGGGGITGCSDVSEFPNVTIELVRRGYSENEIRKIWGGNFMRVFREVREKAGETD